MTRRPIILEVTLFGAALLVGACGGQQTAAQQTAAQQTTETTEVPETVTATATQTKVTSSDALLPKPLRALLKDLYSLEGLTAKQTQRLDALRLQIRRRTASCRALHAAVLEEAAKQIRAGRLEQAAIEAHLAKMHATMTKTIRPLIVASLDELHRTLSAAQRHALVAKLKARHEARSPHERMRKLAEKLGLDQSQRQQVRAVLFAQLGDTMAAWAKRRGEHRARMKAAAEAFLRDDFKASELSFAKASKRDLSEIKVKIAGAKGVLNSLLPILTNAQREAIATLIEQRAAMARLAVQLSRSSPSPTRSLRARPLAFPLPSTPLCSCRR
ncbi:MAG: hypothetical protein CSA65_00940 [Proteobacteria bacterium]|nr:MAG: hypothetical protein CSA65_00940 [Pseudomonadota bacterium]